MGDFAPTGASISYGVKIWTDLSSVLSQCTRLTDGQTDRQLSHRYSAVKMLRLTLSKNNQAEAELLNGIRNTIWCTDTADLFTGVFLRLYVRITRRPTYLARLS